MEADTLFSAQNHLLYAIEIFLYLKINIMSLAISNILL